MWPIRTAVSGKQMTPGGATELMEILGKEESIARIKKGLNYSAIKGIYGKRYNDSQVKAIGHFNGPCLTLAGPGSGKTAVITERTKNLITKYHVDPSNILVITFTKAAALEMKNRFLSLMGNGSYPDHYFGINSTPFILSILKHAYNYNDK